MGRVIVILVNYNGSDLTIQCIESIKKSKYNDYAIVVVDNNSKLDDYIKIKDRFEGDNSVVLIRNNKNVGFAGGNNRGIEYVLKNEKFEYILLLNNDTVINDNAVSELVSVAMMNEKIGIVGGKIYYYKPNNKIWYAGGSINWKKFITKHYGENDVDNGQFQNIKEVEFITGCCMLIKKQVLCECGLLPEDYFMYYEDVDYCVNVKEKGYKLYYTPYALIYHKVSSASGGEKSAFSIKYGTRNRKKFMKKFKYKVTNINYLCAIIFFYSTRIILIFMYILEKKYNKAKAIIKGLIK